MGNLTGKKHVFTTGDVEKIRQLTEEGRSQSEIAKVIGCSSSAIGLYRKKIGITPTTKGGKLTAEQLKMIEDLSNHKFDQLIIAEKVGCSVWTVRRYQQLTGIPASNRTEPSGQHKKKIEETNQKEDIVVEEKTVAAENKKPINNGDYVTIANASISVSGNRTGFTYEMQLLGGEIIITTGYGEPIPLDARDLVAFGNELLDMAEKINQFKKMITA